MSDLSITNALVIVALGLTATAVMTLVLKAARWSHLIDVDILDTLGSVFTRSRAKYHAVGWTVHLCAGVLFAFLYVALWNMINIKTPTLFLLVGGIIGALHGIMVSFFVTIYVAEHHRLRRLRGASGFGIAVLQWGAHIVYGLSLGLAATAYFWWMAHH